MSTINQNNIIDVDDSQLLANTPMMVVEQGGSSYAIPLMSKGGGIEQVQADWQQTDNTAVDFIKNKPEIAPGMALQKIITDEITASAVISNMEANTRYVFTIPLVHLSVMSVEDSNFESEIQFTANSQTLTVRLPETLKIIGYPSFVTGKAYIINVKNNIAVIAEVEGDI